MENRRRRKSIPRRASRVLRMRYLVGIDLGTTNSALAYIDLQNKPRVGNLGLKTFPVPQLVAAGQMGERSLLPSFLYLPGPHDLPAGSVALPWIQNSGPAGFLGQIVAVPSGRGPDGALAAVERPAGSPPVEPAGGFHPVPAAFCQGLEQHAQPGRG